MLGDDYGSILGDVAGSLFAAGLNDKAAEATKVNVFSVCERFLDNFHELLKGSEDGSMPVVLAISLTISALVIVR